MELDMKKLYIAVLVGLTIYIIINFHSVVYSVRSSFVPKNNTKLYVSYNTKFKEEYKQNGMDVVEYRNAMRKIVKRDYYKKNKLIKTVIFYNSGSNSVYYYNKSKMLRRETYSKQNVTITVRDYVMLTDKAYYSNGNLKKIGKLSYVDDGHGGKTYKFRDEMKMYYDMDKKKPVLRKNLVYKDDDIYETSYYENGNIKSEGKRSLYTEMRNGIKYTFPTNVGKWNNYNEEGVKVSEYTYADKKIIEVVGFDEDGDIMYSKRLNPSGQMIERGSLEE